MSEAPQIPSQESAIGIYLSAAMGALFLGIGDLLNNQTAATVLKLSQAIRQNLYPQLESGGLVALALLVIFGAGVCWVQQPRTRVDAFARGFSVFALMAVTAPYNPAAEGLNNPADHAGASGLNGLFGISAAYAGNQAQPVPIEITLAPLNTSALPADAKLTLRALDTGEILGTTRIRAGKLTISQPSGHYLLEVDAPGFRRTAAELYVDGTGKRINIPIEESSVPLSIQRLYAPDRASEK